MPLQARQRVPHLLGTVVSEALDEGDAAGAKAAAKALLVFVEELTSEPRKNTPARRADAEAAGARQRGE